MDERTHDSMRKWDALSAAGVQYSRPWLDLTPEAARARVDREGMMGEVAGKRVLCLAASGGQQSAAFALLGAQVTVLDFSENQLAKDRATADRYGVSVETIHGDMQDLSGFAGGQFDLIWFAHSINFIPGARSTIAEVGRICGSGGLFRINFTNPYVHGIWDCFQDGGYLLSQPYADGAEVRYADPRWQFIGEDGRERRIDGPTEFRHRLSTIVNSIIASGFELLGLWEDAGEQTGAQPGSWEHFKSVAPPWITVWGRRRGGANG